MPKPASAHDRSALDRRLVSAVAWTAAAKWGSQLISSGSLLIQARLLSPADFGILGMTYILIGFINILAEFGIGSAIVVMRELSLSQVRQTHLLAVLLGAAGSGITVLAAEPAAAFFRKPELVAVIPVVGIGFLLSGFRTVPQALLARDLKFKTIAAIEAASLVTTSFTTLALAWGGFRYWSLVIGGLAGTALAMLLFCAASPCGFARPVFRQVRGQLAYSQRLLVGRAAYYGYSNADFLVAGRLLGESVLGVYNMAWNLANAPVDRVVSLILRVTPSVFSSVQHDGAELRRYLRVLTEGMALIILPVGLGVALVAGPAVSVLFDKRWAGLAMPLRLLAITAIFRCLFSLSGQVQATIRDVRYLMWQSLVCMAVMVPAFCYASRWGGAGIAGAWLCLYPVINVPPVVRTLRRIQMPAREYLGSIRSAGFAAAAMTGAVLAAHHSLYRVRPLVELIVEPVIGAVVYLGILLLFFRPRVDAFIGLLRRRQARPGLSPLAQPLAPGNGRYATGG